MLDSHVVAAVQHGWELYKGNAAAFAELFFGFEPAVVAGWHAKLVAAPPTCHLWGNPGPHTEGWPGVCVELLDESPSTRFLGDFGEVADDGRDVLSMFVDQSVRVDLYTNSPEATRVLHVLVRAILLQTTHNFLNAGYLDFKYDGVDPLSFEEMLAAEQMGIVTRRMRYSGSAPVRVKRLETAPTSKTWFVLAGDQQLDGDPGGVLPSAP